MKWPLRVLSLLTVSLLLDLSFSPLVFAQDNSWSSSKAHSSIERRWEENLPPSRTQEPKINPKATEEQKVPHPFAKRGLTRITRDKTYVYHIKKSDQKRASSIRFGFFNPTQLTQPETGLSFSSLYPDSNNMLIIFYDYEWQLWKSFGKLGWKLGTGICTASGNGAFTSVENASLQPREKFTFIAFPNSISIIYRLQFWDTQLIVPYIEGGGDIMTFTEIRDDDKLPRFGLSPAAHMAAGASLNLGLLDKNSVVELDREYSINDIWITGEFRALLGLDDQFDFTSNIINLGFLFEF